jgi:serine protease Do
MRNVRMLTLTALLVVVLGLSACTVTLPAASAGLSTLNQQLGNLLPRTNAPAQSAAQTAATTATANVPQLVPPATDISDLQMALEQLYTAVNPTVVNIQVTMAAGADQLEQIPGLPDMPNLPGLPFQLNPNSPDGQGTPQQTPQARALGSGFVWDKQGHIVTNNHVVDGAEKVTVTFADGLTLDAEVVGRDPESDLAVVKVDPSKADLRPITLADSTQVKVGQFAVAIGNPFGLEGSMSFGIVSALGRSLPTSSSTLGQGGPSYTIPDIIQTDAPVNPGNSGGVLLDLQGNLIGVPTAIESPVRGSSGVGYAVPSIIVQKVVPDLIVTGDFVHPYIGLSGGTLNTAMAKAMNLPDSTRGVLVGTVSAGSPAEKAGLQGSDKDAEIDGQQVKIGGDVITAIAGQPVKDFEDLTTYLARTGKVGQQVELTILRDGKETSVTLTLAARPNSQPQSSNQNAPQTTPQTASGGAWLGVSGMTLTPDVAQAMNLSNDQAGALIEDVTSGSPAEKAGLKASTQSFTDSNGQQVMIGGDVVTAVDGKAVATMQDLSTAIRAQKPGDTVELTVLRNGNEVTVSVTLGQRTGAQAAPAPRNQQPQQPQQPQAATGGAWLGISGLTVTPDVASAMNLSNDQTGALVEEVVTGSPADKAGLQASDKAFDSNGQQVMIGGDVVTAVDGKAVETMQDLSAAVKAQKPGDEIELTVLRDGKEITVAVTLGERQVAQAAPAAPAAPTEKAPEQPKTAATGAWLGISGLTLTSDVADAMSLNSDQKGTLVEEVVTGSPADKVGLQASDKAFDSNGQQVLIGGDVITSVDGKAVESMEDLSAAVKAQKPGDKVELTVLRNGKEITVTVSLGARPAQSN